MSDVATRNPCPTCSKPPQLVALAVVYPQQIGLSDRAVLVCWDCWRGKPLQGQWQDVDRRRHEKGWKSETKQQRRKDREGA